MSASRRGRGGEARGGRGARGGGSNIFQRGSTRGGKPNGVDAPTRPTSTPQNSLRGGASSRGGQDTRNSTRGRGLNKTKNGDSTSITPDPSSKSNNSMNSTPFPADDYQSRLDYLREDRPRQRKLLIENGFMDPDHAIKFEDRVEKYGLCTDMCSEYERVRRIVEMDYKAAECTPETAHGPRKQRIPDESRMVKAHTRSAAGTEMELVTDVRTPGTCLQTLKWMFRRLDTDGMNFMYGFIWDRSRSVRKDLSVGALKPGQESIYLECVEMCVRFHLLSLHQMALGTSPDYNPAIDVGNDLEQLKNCYTSLTLHYPSELARETDPPHRAEFIAYDIVLSLSFGGSMFKLRDEKIQQRYSGTNKRITTALAIKQAYGSATTNEKVTLGVKRRSWNNFWRLIKSQDVTYLMACAAELCFNDVRHDVLYTLRAVYRPRPNVRPKPQDDWTLEKLMEPLGFDGIDDVREHCEAYGFTIKNNADGVEYVDLGSLPGGLVKPQLRQYHSATIVEPKRYDRTLAAVIEEADAVASDQGNGGSLFVPNAQDQSAKSQLNPFVPAFTPKSTSSGNPFLGNMQPSPFSNSGAIGGATPATVRPGLWDASKDKIQFGPTPTPNGTSFPSAATDNPFNKAASTTPTAPNPFMAPAATLSSPTTASPFAVAPPAAASYNAFQQPTSQSSGPWSFSSTTQANQNGNLAPSSSTDPSTDASQQKPFFNFAAPTPPEASVNTQEEEKRKAREEQRIADEKRRALEEKERQALAERRAREEQERQARAAVEQRRLQAEQERQRQLREEERRVRAEQERQAELERLRQSQLEAERRAQQEHDQALSTLANNILMDPEQGLMSQYIEHMVAKMTKTTAEQLEEQRLQDLAEKMYQQRRLAFVRAVCVRWVQQVEKKKKKAGIRRRREELRALRAKADTLPRTSAPDVRVLAVQHNTKPKGAQAPVVKQSDTALDGSRDTFKKPSMPAGTSCRKEPSASRNKTKSTQRMDDTHRKSIANGNQSAQNISTVAFNGVASSADYSQNYHRSTAPADRTETDWFELRAKGVDPSKHRKRSFGSVSGDDDVSIVESKRARRSTSSSFRRSLPAPNTEDELIARFKAVREANRVNRTRRSFSGNQSVNGTTSAVIAQARELLANSPTPQQSPPTSHHKYSRSVPGVELSNPSAGLSMFGRSIGAAPTNERPAFWGRTSRFVPQHLYGKGPEAIRAYRDQLHGRSRSHKAPVELSSPMPTQLSYIPTSGAQCDYEKMSEHAGDDADSEDVDEDQEEYDNEDDSIIDYNSPPNMEQEQDGMFQEEYEEEYYDEEDESEMSDEPPQQYGQQPGGTQDDAIELSD